MVLGCLATYAQQKQVMYIYQGNGQLLKLDVHSIDSITFVSCADEEEPIVNPVRGIPMTFSIQEKSSQTRASGSSVAEKVGREFNIFGYREAVGGATTRSGNWQTFIDDYCVWWNEGSANATPTNTAGWEYVGQQGTPTNSAKGRPASLKKDQTAHYWTSGGDKYHFIAYSAPEPSGNVTISFNTGSGNMTRAGGEQGRLTLAGVKEASDVYLSDAMIDRTDSGDASTVAFRMTPLSAYVRLAFYETIPGYSVMDLRFHEVDEYGDFTDATASALTLTGDFVPETVDIRVDYSASGREVKYANASLAGKKQMHLSFSEESAIGTSSSMATFLTASGEGVNGYFVPIFPRTYSSRSLRFMLDYTLVATDGSSETIKVKNVPVEIPASYAAMQSGYKYTYLFKVYDNSGAWTSTENLSELMPCKLDACIVEDSNSNQDIVTFL